MKRVTLALIAALAIGLTAQIAGASSSPPYPFNFEPYIKLNLTAPKLVKPNSKVWVRMDVENTSKWTTPALDLTLTLLEAPDDQTPLRPSKVVQHKPPVAFDKYDRDSWIVGSLTPGQSKTFLVRVQVPKKIPLWASRWCYIAYKTMSQNTRPFGSWSEYADNGDQCASIWR